MKPLIVSLLSLSVFGFSACTHADSNENVALKEQLVKLEKRSWEAWQHHDSKFFQEFLSDDHVEVGFNGLGNKADIVAVVASPICQVKSYSVDHFDLKRLGKNTALLTYRESQDTTCGGKPVPSPCWVSSLYIKRGDRWLNVAYQQTQIAG